MCLILIILGALFWGIGGTVAKKLFQYGIDMGSFVTVRLLIAGILLLLPSIVVIRAAENSFEPGSRADDRILDEGILWRISMDGHALHHDHGDLLSS
ncbi:EamA family transporter [Paenibacillus sp. FSL H7-0326]